MKFAEELNDIRRRAGLKEQIEDYIRSDYYEGHFPRQALDDAYDHYADYMKKQGHEVEVDESLFLDAPEQYIDHVLYHAEINGFPVEEYIIN